VLRDEALVEVLVPGQDDVHVALDEDGFEDQAERAGAGPVAA
jgi:hypothetical protein